MRLAVVCESVVDEAVIRLLIDTLYGEVTEHAEPVRRRQGGWTAVLRDFPTHLKAIHYGQKADALVAVIDSYDEPVHVPAHDEPDARDPDCRLCEFRRLLEQTRAHLTPIAGRPPLRVALGLAVPSLEAWLSVGRNQQVNEAAWIRARESGQFPYDRKRLKEDLYGSDRAPQDLMRERATAEAQRLATDLSILERWFPHGFAPLAEEVRSWRPAED